MGDPQGSVWRRWDPHLHAPGTALNDQFDDVSISDYLDAIENAGPPLAAVGITDYLSTACYEGVMAARHDGRLSGIGLVFPNIELRLSIGTKAQKAVNLHMLVSPEDTNHVAETNRFLNRLSFAYGKDKYCCKRDELIALGRAHDSKLTDDAAAYAEGVNQFKVDFNQLRHEVKESEWVQQNVLFAVAGSSNDGTAGMQDDTSSFAAQRVEIEAFCHIVFASSENQVKFWLGEGVLDKAAIEGKYRSLKPCLHGSDAHSIGKVGQPDLDRYTWIKGDATFDALRQACIEPAERAFVGAVPPIVDASERACVHVRSHGAAWLIDAGLPINPGLVAIIGGRGSGKTALADLIARGAGNSVPLLNEKSFVQRAHLLLGSVESAVTWSSGRLEQHHVRSTDDGEDEAVHYLSQQFVDRLCSADGPNDELVREIQKVVFSSHPLADRLGATNFDELLLARTGHTQQRREFLRARLDRIADDVLAQRLLKEQLPAKEKAKETAQADLKQDMIVRNKLVRKGEQERANYYERLKSAIDERLRGVQDLDRRSSQLGHLLKEAESYETHAFPDLHSQLRARFDGVALNPSTWAALEIAFKGAWREEVQKEIEGTNASLLATRKGSNDGVPTPGLTEVELRLLPLDALQAALEQLSKEIGLDHDAARKLKALNQRISQRQQDVERFDKEIEVCRKAEEAMRSLITERATVYEAFFETVIEEESALGSLYEPLEQHLLTSSETVRRLNLVVIRRVDLVAWAARGEELLDLRKTGKFKGRGSLAQFAEEHLLEAWQSGSADEVSVAMANFRTEYDAAILAQSSVDRASADYRGWTLDVGRWLYSTDHIDVSYSFEYDGVGLGQLSPGTRGVVLLLLYLALDLDDDRPLIIDQPEENLDPRTIYADLVSLFGEVRRRRQVIMVTHNANLVVNTDVDQVIVATSERVANNAAPKFSYRSGGLEDPAIRADVCEILEGGRAAFLERAKRLRVAT